MHSPQEKGKASIVKFGSGAPSPAVTVSVTDL